jgi:hypothetical protein
LQTWAGIDRLDRALLFNSPVSKRHGIAFPAASKKRRRDRSNLSLCPARDDARHTRRCQRASGRPAMPPRSPATTAQQQQPPPFHEPRPLRRSNRHPDPTEAPPPNRLEQIFASAIRYFAASFDDCRDLAMSLDQPATLVKCKVLSGEELRGG